jgi:hypothetical protein
MKTKIAAAAFLALPATALAAPPNACDILKAEEINKIAVSKVDSVQVQKTGNPSQCGFLDGRKAAVLTVSIREVQYAVKDEIFEEKSQLEKIYKAKAKDLDTVGDGGYWHPAFKQLGFRRGKTIVNVKFNIKENQSEVDTAQIARIVDSRLPK